MPLLYDLNARVINLGDTVNLQAWVRDEHDQPITSDRITNVTFTIQDANGIQTAQDGDINDDNSGSCIYGPTALEGLHTAIASFTLDDGQVKSVPVYFDVVNPFLLAIPASVDVLAEAVWTKLEDTFDSELGGPWLTDVSKDYFNREKMTMFVQDALFDINQQNPPTAVDIGEFISTFTTPPTLTINGPLLVQGTYLTILRHLIRSYVEQPLPQGAQVVYQDRRDYMDRWANVYKMEMDVYKRWVALWKRSFLGLGSIRSLISSKSGRNLGAPMRSPYSASRGFFRKNPDVFAKNAWNSHTPRHNLHEFW